MGSSAVTGSRSFYRPSSGCDSTYKLIRWWRVLCLLADCQHGEHRLENYLHLICIKGNQLFPFMLSCHSFLLLILPTPLQVGEISKKTRCFSLRFETFCTIFCAKLFCKISIYWVYFLGEFFWEGPIYSACWWLSNYSTYSIWLLPFLLVSLLVFLWPDCCLSWRTFDPNFKK
jgi:hypothetical protein